MANMRKQLERFGTWNCFSDSTTKSNPYDPKTQIPPSTSSSSNIDEITTPSSNTTIILSHGAFHSQYHYQSYITALQTTTQINRIIVPEQLSSGTTPPANCFPQDVANIHATITAELRNGRDVLLVTHSYGSIPACEALSNLPSSTPPPPPENDEDGTTPVTGRILGIIFVTAYVLDQGQSLVTAYHQRAEWVKIEEDTGLCYISHPDSVIYTSLTTSTPQTLKSELIAHLLPQALSSFTTETEDITWRDFPCYYIRCTADRALPVEQQDFFVERLRRLVAGGGRKESVVVVKDLPADHVPFASMPGRLAGLTEEILLEIREQESRV